LRQAVRGYTVFGLAGVAGSDTLFDLPLAFQHQNRLVYNSLTKRLLVAGLIDRFDKLLAFQGSYVINIISEEVEEKHQDEKYDRYTN
jgi:hypothetical protein